MHTSKLKPFLVLLCKIFLIGLLLQFFLQTFITFQLGRDGTVWNVIWMWKEFILLLLAVAVVYALAAPLLKGGVRGVLSTLHPTAPQSSPSLRNVFAKPNILQFILLFFGTSVVFFLIAVLVQKVWLSTFILSFKYDLLPFFIFGLGVCVGILFFTEKDKELFKLYKKLMVRCLRGGLFRWALVYFMPNALKFFGYNRHAYEGTMGSNPPAAYYTLINKGYVRNQFLFERPLSLGFRLVAFFPFFVLGFLRKKTIKVQLGYALGFWLLVLSTWSRAGIAVFGVEVVLLALFLHWKILKKWLWILILLTLCGVGGVAYLGANLFAREHSNTGHLVLVVEGRKLAQKNLITWRGAGYSGPASHQLCYEAQDNWRCEEIKRINTENEISTYGYNPENQYLQILMEYGILGTLCRLALLAWVLGYTIWMLRIYRKTEKSPYQTFLYCCLVGFSLWLVGLCAEGMVLHSLGDRMVVYPFFLLYGLAVWGWEQVKDEVYILEAKEKKEKKRKKKKRK